MNLVNEGGFAGGAAQQAHRDEGRVRDARDKIMMGAERRTLMLTDEEKSASPPITKAATRWCRST